MSADPLKEVLKRAVAKDRSVTKEFVKVKSLFQLLFALMNVKCVPPPSFKGVYCLKHSSIDFVRAMPKNLLCVG